MAEICQSKTFSLADPVMVGGVETTTITMRPPKVRDAFEIGQPGMAPKDFEFAMMARLCGASVEELMDFPLGLGSKIREAYEDFLSRQGGHKSNDLS